MTASVTARALVGSPAPSKSTASPSELEAYRTTGTSPGLISSVEGCTGLAPLPGEWKPEHHPDWTSPVAVPFEVAGPERAPTLLVLGGISASKRVTANGADPGAGWWREIAGPGLPVDPTKWRLVGFDYLGRPGTLGSDSGLWLSLTAADQARAALAVLDHLGLARVSGVIGASYGGTVALALAAAAPGRVGRVLTLAGAHRSHPHAVALRGIQQRIVSDGIAKGEGPGALALARALAHSTYRSPEDFDSRFDQVPSWAGPDPVFEVQAYLSERGRRFAQTFDPWAYLTLSRSIDISFVDPASVAAPLTVVGFDPDALVPQWLIEELAASLPQLEACRIVRSRYGHDAFLKAGRELNALVGRFLSECRGGAR